VNARNKPASYRPKHLRLVIILLVSALLLYFLSGPTMIMVGEFLVKVDEPARSDAVVVLSTGIEYYPRLMEAAMLFQDGFAERVAINGNRMSEALRELERRGFRRCSPWYEDTVRVLEFLGVPREKVFIVSAEDAYDTVSEAKLVGEVLSEAGITSILLTTSKYHTRRARYIWKKLFSDRFTIRAVAARDDPFSTKAWWKEGRQARWVLAEYGAWIYYFWKTGWSNVK
jgi:uncharacterized SAM-binding protein YcdF (DUF218 family)